MRISSTMMTDNYLTQLNNIYENQVKLMEQADGSKLHRASDDAIGYSKYLRYTNSQNENEQYTTNVKTGISWMKNSDSALINVNDCFSTVVAKTNQAANSYNSGTDMMALSTEISSMVDQAVSDANIFLDGRYLFSGQSDTTQPFHMSEKTTSRGLAKTLDDSQAQFFGDNATKSPGGSGDVAQMLTLKDDDGNEYYLSTLTGDIYDYEFMSNGYKKKVAAGQTEVNPPTDRFRNIGGALDVSDHFTNQGVIKEGSAGKGTDWEFNTTVTDEHGNPKSVRLTFATIKQKIVTYKGDFKDISMTKKNGKEDQNSDAVNVTARDMFGSDIFDNKDSGNYISGTANLNNLYTIAAKTENGDVIWLDSDGVTLANNTFDTTVVTQTKLGARLRVYQDVQTMLEDQNTTITGDISRVADTDVAKLAVMLNTISTIYSMSLSVGGRVLPQSLADYL